ncbi:hypothetical protein THTE_1155 [Thermogutta terrifontis]|uniref:Uncharacterized protein n=1 Tax=Thermogutta terrifontis TaxID=1331910 RepID=A0A286RCW1_9BACT|nr:hypothetical protein THTE_1155 [Thermogutta terrifontis]
MMHRRKQPIAHTRVLLCVFGFGLKRSRTGRLIKRAGLGDGDRRA